MKISINVSIDLLVELIVIDNDRKTWTREIHDDCLEMLRVHIVPKHFLLKDMY